MRRSGNQKMNNKTGFIANWIAEQSLAEGKLTVKNFDAGEYKRHGGPQRIKNAGLKIVIKKGKGFMGADLAILSGKDKDLIAYSKVSFDTDGRTLKDVQAELD